MENVWRLWKVIFSETLCTISMHNLFRNHSWAIYFLYYCSLSLLRTIVNKMNLFNHLPNIKSLSSIYFPKALWIPLNTFRVLKYSIPRTYKRKPKCQFDLWERIAKFWSHLYRWSSISRYFLYSLIYYWFLQQEHKNFFLIIHNTTLTIFQIVFKWKI